jgi:hypothetical protein
MSYILKKMNPELRLTRFRVKKSHNQKSPRSMPVTMKTLQCRYRTNNGPMNICNRDLKSLPFSIDTHLLQ